MGNRKSPGEGSPDTMASLAAALIDAGIEDVAVVKTATGDYAWLVRDVESLFKVLPVKKGNRVVAVLGQMTRNEWIEAARAAYHSVHPPRVVEGRYFILAGNAFTGYSFYGPFKNEQMARDWAHESHLAMQHVIVEATEDGGRVMS